MITVRIKYVNGHSEPQEVEKIQVIGAALCYKSVDGNEYIEPLHLIQKVEVQPEVIPVIPVSVKVDKPEVKAKKK